MKISFDLRITLSKLNFLETPSEARLVINEDLVGFTHKFIKGFTFFGKSLLRQIVVINENLVGRRIYKELD